MVPYGNNSLNSYSDASDLLFYHEYDSMQLIFTFLIDIFMAKEYFTKYIVPTIWMAAYIEHVRMVSGDHDEGFAGIGQF